MKPKRPVLWYVLVVITLFAINYFFRDLNRSLIHQILYALLVGAAALGALYGMDKIRMKFISGSNGN